MGAYDYTLLLEELKKFMAANEKALRNSDAWTDIAHGRDTLEEYAHTLDGQERANDYWEAKAGYRGEFDD